MDNTFVAEGAYRHFGVIFSSIDWRRCSEYKLFSIEEGGCYYLYLSWRSLFVTLITTHHAYFFSCILCWSHSASTIQLPPNTCPQPGTPASSRFALVLSMSSSVCFRAVSHWALYSYKTTSWKSLIGKMSTSILLFGIVFDIRNVSVSLYCLHIYKQIPGCIYTC